MKLEEIYQEMELYKLFLKDYLDLYIYFSAHLKKTTYQINNEILFKKEFTFERWKQGFVNYSQNKPLFFLGNNMLENVKLKSNYIKINYNQYRFIPFNIRIELK